MPDLGDYAATVLAAYGAGLALLAGIVVLTWIQSRRAKRLLDDAERRLRGD